MARLILGHTTHDSIKIWFRASARWPVAFVDVVDTAGRRTRDTRTVITTDEDFHTGTITWDGLAANAEYRVKVAFGKSREDGKDERVRAAYTEGEFRTFPEPDATEPFSFLFGSCNLHSLGILQRPDRAWTKISRVAVRNAARFMIHCGDQIYADIPLPAIPDLGHYRNKYLDAWSDCVPARRFLTELPHYMILDDHEITDNYAADMTGHPDPAALSRVAFKVYWEFQHRHNPDTVGENYRYDYTFAHGAARFFIMDTRQHRDVGQGVMLDPVQEADLHAWLRQHRDRLKFIVTSVPFLTEVRNPKKDKWCDPNYKEQRARILRTLLENGNGKTVFLTGDKHAACHTTAKLWDDNGNRVTLHELMSSPINQFTPNHDITTKLVPAPPPTPLPNGLTLQSRVAKDTFVAKHSNIMAVRVGKTGNIRFRIYRTGDKDMSPIRYRSFTP